MDRPQPPADDDASLVEAALRDHQAYAGLVRRYEPRLRRYVRRLLGTLAQSTDDVLQDAFIRAYLNLNDYDPARPFSPWIYRIAHNEAITALRRQRAGLQMIDGEDAVLILERLAADGTPESDLLSARRAEDLHAALSRLDPRYRAVLVLRYLEEMSYDEISEVLAIPPGTVATHLRRGLGKLRTPGLLAWAAA